MKPRRIQMTRNRPWRADHPDAVIVARPSRWGNPWRAGDPRDTAMRAEVVSEYRRALLAGDLAVTVTDVRAELAGRDLACWCPLPEPGQSDYCHAAVLLAIANEETDTP